MTDIQNNLANNLTKDIKKEMDKLRSELQEKQANIEQYQHILQIISNHSLHKGLTG